MTQPKNIANSKWKIVNRYLVRLPIKIRCNFYSYKFGLKIRVNSHEATEGSYQ